ncbi:MAG: putative quinol monooxygenase [Sphingobium sp.]
MTAKAADMHDRREILGLAATAAALLSTPATAQAVPRLPRYGLIGQMLAKPGKRDELLGYLQASTGAMPGCQSYIIALDPTNPDALWITEVWESKDSHAASLKLPAVREAIAKARPIIAGFGQSFETVPVAGI